MRVLIQDLQFGFFGLVGLRGGPHTISRVRRPEVETNRPNGIWFASINTDGTISPDGLHSSLRHPPRMEVWAMTRSTRRQPDCRTVFLVPSLYENRRALWDIAIFHFLGFLPRRAIRCIGFSVEVSTRDTYSSSSLLTSRLSQSATQIGFPTASPQRNSHKIQETHFGSQTVRQAVDGDFNLRHSKLLSLVIACSASKT